MKSKHENNNYQQGAQYGLYPAQYPQFASPQQPFYGAPPVPSGQYNYAQLPPPIQYDGHAPPPSHHIDHAHAPYPSPLMQATGGTAINSSFIASKHTHMKVKPKDGKVKVDGKQMFKTTKHTFSSKLDFKTSCGQHLFTIKEHSFSSFNSYELVSANGTPLVRVGEHFSSKFDVSFRNAVSPWEDVALQMKSHGWSEKKWDITRKSTGQPLAFMKLDGHGGKKYELEVEAGTDLSLIAALALIVNRRMTNVSEAMDAANVAGTLGGAGA